MILYDLFKVLDTQLIKCTVIACALNSDTTILDNGDLCMVDNKAMYYIVDRITIKDKTLFIYVIER